MRTRNQRKHLPIKYEKDEKASDLAEARRKTDVPPTLIKEIKTEAVEVSADVSVKKEVKVEEAEAITDVTIKKEPKKRKSGGVKVKSEPASEILPKTKVKSLEDYKQSKWMPNNWEETLENMRTMRSDRAAPVDTMGCHKCADPEADEKVNSDALSLYEFTVSDPFCWYSSADTTLSQPNRTDVIQSNQGPDHVRCHEPLEGRQFDTSIDGQH